MGEVMRLHGHVNRGLSAQQDSGGSQDGRNVVDQPSEEAHGHRSSRRPTGGRQRSPGREDKVVLSRPNIQDEQSSFCGYPNTPCAGFEVV